MEKNAELVQELDQLRLDYKTAVDAWGGGDSGKKKDSPPTTIP